VKKAAKGSLNLNEKIITPAVHITSERKRPQKKQLSKTNYQVYSDETNKNNTAVSYRIRK